MVCIKCKCECIALSSENPEEVLCEDCAFPALSKARKAAALAVEEEYFKRTGIRKTCGEIFRECLFRADKY